MLINGGVVVCKLFLANARQCFEMGGVILGGNCYHNEKMIMA